MEMTCQQQPMQEITKAEKMVEEKKHFNTARLIKQIVVIFLMFGGKYLPPIGEMTPYGMHIFCILVGAVFGWVFIDFIFTNICAIIAFGFTGTFDSLVDCFGACFGSDSAVMMLGCLVMCAFIEVMDLTTVIVSALLNLKIAKKNIYVFFFLFFVADWAVGLVSHPALAALLFGTMYGQMAAQAGVPARTRINSFFLCGIALIAVFGDIGLPFRPPAIAMMGAIEAYTGEAFPFLDYVLYVTLFQFIMIGVWLLIGKFIFRINFSQFKAAEPKKVESSRRQRVGLICILITMVTFIFASMDIPALSYLKLGGVALCTMIVMMLIQIDGKPLLDLGEISAKFNWGMYFFVAFFLTFANYISLPECGITDSFKSWLEPLLTTLPPFAFFIIAMLLATILTNILNNLPVALIFISIMFAAGGAMTGINLEAASVALIMASYAACATPAANPPNAVVFSFTELIDPKISLLVGSIACLILCLVAIVIYYPLLCLFM